MTELQQELDQLPLVEIARACREQTSRYRHGQASDSRFCLEIFRRALQNAEVIDSSGTPVYVDEDAREILVTIYTDFIRGLIQQRALRILEPDDVVQEVWRRFWQRTNQGITLTSLERILSLLKLMTVRTILTLLRVERGRSYDVSLDFTIETYGDTLIPDPSPEPFDLLRQKQFRARCRELLHDPIEFWCFTLRFSRDLPPRDIAKVLREHGFQIRGRTPTPGDVGDVLERIVKRFRQDEELNNLR